MSALDAEVAPLARFGLGRGQLAQLGALLSLLADDETAPSAIREPSRAAAHHLADSLVALELEAVRAAGFVVDLGSGAGFPGLPLAVALPHARVTLLESQRRRCDYLERALGLMRVENAEVVCARAEQWRDGLERADVALARALAAQPVVLEYAAPLMRIGGVLVDWRGERSEQEEDAAERAATALGLRRCEIRRAVPFAQARQHHLHVFEKVAQTPGRFPRRPGVARKRPLGR